MATELFTLNEASTTVSSGGTTAPAQGTGETWTVASSATFPTAVSGTSQFHVADPVAPTEIIAVTNVSGTTWTVTRGAESTTPATHAGGFTVQQVFTAGWAASVLQSGKNLGDVASTSTARTNLGLGTAATQAATAFIPATDDLSAIAAAVPTAGNVPMNSHKLTGLANGTASTDAAAFGQIPTSLSLPSLTFTFGSTGAVPSSGTFTAGSVAVDQNGLPRFCTVGGNPGTWQRIGAAPHQFFADDYGAKGDGAVCTVNTTATSAAVTATSAAFTSTGVDGGKHVMVHGANGTTSGPLITTVSTVTDSTHATLASAPGVTVSACPAVFGTDDTAAINNCLSAAGAYALAADYLAEVIFSGKIYIVAAAPTQSTSPVTQNSQIVLPYPAVDGTTQKLIITLTGAGDAGYCQYYESLIPNAAGSALVSMQTAPSTPDATFGNQSVIGGPSEPAGLAGGFANVKAIVQNLSVWCPIWTNMYAYDFGFVSAMRFQQSSAHIFAPTGFNGSAVQPWLSSIGATAFLNSIGSGLRTPTITNNDAVYAEDSVVEGYECAFRAFDHFTFKGLRAIYSDVVMFFNSTQGGSSTSHNIVGDISAENYNGGLLSNGGTIQVDLTWDAEIASPSYDVSDSANGLRGIFRFRDPQNNRAPIVSNAANLKVIDDRLGPGHQASPTFVLGTALLNPFWRDTFVTITGGTVSGISIDGTATGLTSGAFVWPSGKTMTISGSGLPTVTCWCV